MTNSAFLLQDFVSFIFVWMTVLQSFLNLLPTFRVYKSRLFLSNLPTSLKNYIFLNISDIQKLEFRIG